MKKLSYMLLVAVAFLVACQKIDDTLLESKEDAWLDDLSLPVPIQFGSTGTVATKAGVNPDNGHFPVGLELGVLGVNNAPDYRWTLNAKDFLWFNESTKKENIGRLVTDSGGKVAFEDGNGNDDTRYYPINSDVSYDFYGYYPYQNAAGKTAIVDGPWEGRSTGDGAKIDFDIGPIDVLWAYAGGEEYNSVKGFNAKYIREITNAAEEGPANNTILDDNLPHLEFRHMLAKIKLEVNSGKEADNKVLMITSVDITGNYNKATLLIASRPTSGTYIYESGTFIDPTPGTIKLCDYSYDFGPKNLTADTELNVLPKGSDGYKGLTGEKADKYYALGYAFVLPTLSWNDYAETEDDPPMLTIDVHYGRVSYDTNGEMVTSNGKPMIADPTVATMTLPYPETGYEEQMQYTYKLTLHDASAAAFKVTLDKVTEYVGNYRDSDGNDIGYNPNFGDLIIN